MGSQQLRSFLPLEMPCFMVFDPTSRLSCLSSAVLHGSETTSRNLELALLPGNTHDLLINTRHELASSRFKQFHCMNRWSADELVGANLSLYVHSSPVSTLMNDGKMLLVIASDRKAKKPCMEAPETYITSLR